MREPIYRIKEAPRLVAITTWIRGIKKQRTTAGAQMLVELNSEVQMLRILRMPRRKQTATTVAQS